MNQANSMTFTDGKDHYPCPYCQGPWFSDEELNSGEPVFCPWCGEEIGSEEVE